MPRATMTTRGRVTIPKEIRDELKLKPGCQINFTFEQVGEALSFDRKRGSEAKASRGLKSTLR